MSRIRRKRQWGIKSQWLGWIVGIIILSVLMMATRHNRTKNFSFQSQLLPGICEAATPTGDRLTVRETAKVHELLSTHPAKEMGTLLLEKFLNGEVCLGKRTVGNDVAHFHAYPKPELGISIPFIYVRSHVLVSGKEQYAQMVIYHEYIHYLQWLAGKIANEERDMETIANGGAQERLRVCKEIWYAEREAYQMECELALSSTVPAELTFCAGVQNGSTVAIEEDIKSTHAWSVTCSSEWQSLSTGR